MANDIRIPDNAKYSYEYEGMLANGHSGRLSFDGLTIEEIVSGETPIYGWWTNGTVFLERPEPDKKYSNEDMEAAGFSILCSVRKITTVVFAELMMSKTER